MKTRGSHSIGQVDAMCDKSESTFSKGITKMGQILSMFFSLVDIYGIYYIVKNDNQIWWSSFSIKHTVSN